MAHNCTDDPERLALVNSSNIHSSVPQVYQVSQRLALRHVRHAVPSPYWGLSVLWEVMKAMPWVLKCVLRSEALSKRRPQTLQLMLPSPSSPSWGEEEEGEP